MDAGISDRVREQCRRAALEALSILFVREPLLGGQLKEYTGCVRDEEAAAGVMPDGSFYVTPLFVGLDKRARLGVIAHETLHALLQHHDRFQLWRKKYEGKYDAYSLLKVFNAAADALINAMLAESGFKLPDDAITPDRIAVIVGQPPSAIIRMSAEELADLLVDKADKVPSPRVCRGFQKTMQGKQGSGAGSGRRSSGCGGLGRRLVKGVDGRRPYEAEVVAAGDNIKTAARTARRFYRSAGHGPGGLVGIIDQVGEGIIDWRARLREAVGSWARNAKRTWRRPSTRLSTVSSDVIYPGVRRVGANIVVVADVSGSMLGDLEYVFGEVERALRATGGTGYAIFFDDGVRAVIRGRSIKGEKIDYGGGTAITPALHVAEHKLRFGDLLVIISDLYWTDTGAALAALRRLRSKHPRIIVLAVGHDPDVAVELERRLGAEVIPVQYTGGA